MIISLLAVVILGAVLLLSVGSFSRLNSDGKLLVLGGVLLCVAVGCFIGFAIQDDEARSGRSNGDGGWGDHADAADTFRTIAFATGGLGALLAVGGLVIRNGSPSAGVTVGSIVRVKKRVTLASGGTIPSGHASKVLALDVIDGVPVAEIDGPAGTQHWVAKANLTPA